MNVSTIRKMTSAAGHMLAIAVLAAAMQLFAPQVSHAEQYETADLPYSLSSASGEQATATVDNIDDLLAALRRASTEGTETDPYVIEVAAGDYTATSFIKVSSHTILRFSDGAVIVNNVGTGSVTDYPIRIEGSTDVSIIGGTLVNGGIWAKNDASEVTISNMTFENPPDSAVKCETGQNFTISGNTIKGSGKHGIYFKSLAGKASVSGNAISDIKVNGIFVYQCANFMGNIANNRLSDVDTVGIKVDGGAFNGKIDGNTLLRCGSADKYGAVYLKSVGGKTTVSKNTITSSKACGIKCEGGSGYVVSGNTVKSNKNYSIYLKGLNGAASISGNTITNSKNDGIFLYENKKVTGNIENNRISDTGQTGIHVAFSAIEGNISGNTVLRAKGNGISLYHGSHCKKITGNHIDTIGGNCNGDAGNYGILLSVAMKGEDGKVYCSSITNNTVRNVTYGGITVYTGKSGKYANYAYVSGSISGNTLYNCGTYDPGKNWKNAKTRGSLAGIYVDKWAFVGGSISKNKVDKSGEVGIYAHDGSTIHSVTDNTVTNSGVDGIQLFDSTCIGNIANNTIKNSARSAFRMSGGTLKGSFSNNKITTTKDKGICITDCTNKSNKKVYSKVTKSISKNTMTNIAGDAIYVGVKSTVATVTGNKATGVKGSGVSLANGAKVTNISSNSFTGKKTKDSRGVLVRTGCKSSTISSNVIKNMGWGISVVDSNNKTTIKGNKISGCTRNVIEIGHNPYKPTAKKVIGKVSINK